LGGLAAVCGRPEPALYYLGNLAAGQVAPELTAQVGPEAVPMLVFTDDPINAAQLVFQ
jgi:hypothetical protein